MVVSHNLVYTLVRDLATRFVLYTSRLKKVTLLNGTAYFTKSSKFWYFNNPVLTIDDYADLNLHLRKTIVSLFDPERKYPIEQLKENLQKQANGLVANFTKSLYNQPSKV